MKLKLLFFFLIVIGFIFQLTATEVSGLPDKFPKEGGAYTIRVNIEYPLYAKNGVEAWLFIPAGVSTKNVDTPVIIWYHGSTKDTQAYISLAKPWQKRAENKKFIFISVQNWWSLSGDYTDGAIDSSQASQAIIESLIQNGWIDGKNVFVTGFSAGGLTAVVTFLQNIPSFYEDGKPFLFHYSGLASFKGNYYQDPVLEPPFAAIDPEKSENYREFIKNKLIWLSIGGKKDAPRVLKQMPEFREYVRQYLLIEPIYKVYPDEGHFLSEQNFEDFWATVVSYLQ
ncbi:MAG: hypothetical protein A2086_13355 [Spirochaetes bacterium GWD1_27_9]|nr:MAG: hypothetical protein A2Z98_01775 [Spirochaetes bacterium GWB1_27_13]OHD25581.1 MAG: hypothetical protein A2Y34_06925 [Spirochaetes bacterium GWC1_27_15]OHD45926.1 MAG: hypothetical protein A2086_13355 [Spirochaetes bacterium GWD1_27_9]